MWFKVALMLLSLWLVHITRLLPLGPFGHVLLLAGLATMLVAFVSDHEKTIPNSRSHTEDR